GVVALVVAAGVSLPAQTDRVRDLDALSAEILSELLDWELDDVAENYNGIEAELRSTRRLAEGNVFDDGTLMVRGGRLLVSEDRLVDDILDAFDESLEEAEECEEDADTPDQFDECDLDLLDLEDEMAEAGTSLEAVVESAVRSIPVAALSPALPDSNAAAVAVSYRPVGSFLRLGGQQRVFARNRNDALGSTKTGVTRAIRYVNARPPAGRR
ncbi:MAG: hypothetical protein ABL982_23860, partial [Vicinamibacterales bacterium]